MDIFNLQKKILNKEARRNGFANWESMKICIKESEGKFIEDIVRKTLIEAKEIGMRKHAQQTLYT